jgi:mannose-6-phosphate isomerase-like protein (cupin superfamily)
MTYSSSESSFGGNRVVALSGEQPVVRLADGSYRYRIVTLGPGLTHVVDDMASYSIYCLSAEASGVELPEGMLRTADVARIEGRTVTLRASANARLLIAGVPTGTGGAPSIAITRSADHYKVSKPWGHELWLNGEHPAYVLKEVFIRSGNRTSLQYHHFKEETNLLVSGTATLVYKAASEIANDDAREPHLGQAKLHAPSFVHIVPEVLHRLIADSDVLLYEASTPHLDDVVRVQDDSGRAHGRIEREHRG